MKTGDHGTFTLGDSKIVGTVVRANGSFTEVQVDGAEEGTYTSLWNEDGWTFAPDSNLPTKDGVWTFYRYGLDADGDMSCFPNLLIRTNGHYYRVFNTGRGTEAMPKSEAEYIFQRLNPVRLTYQEQS